MRIVAPVRHGYTLLEVILAATMALMLLGGLYAAMDTMLSQMDSARELVEDSTVARAILNRIAQDLTCDVSPLQPVSTSSSSTPSTGTSAATTTTTSTTTPLTFQIGVKGDADHAAIFQSRLTRGLINPPVDPNGNTPPQLGDVRRVTYFATSEGLARQEILQASSDLTDSLPDGKDDHTKILAEEVKELKFRYWDGTTWQDSWEGSTPGPDGVTPQGPPQALEISITIQMRPNDPPRSFKQVVAFHTASGPASQSKGTPSTSGTSSR